MKEIRRGFACPCDGEVDVPLRVIRTQRNGNAYRAEVALDDKSITDVTERNLRRFEKALRERTHECPWQAMLDPFVMEVTAAHRHWKVGALEQRYPGGVPAIVWQGIELYDSALGMVITHDAEEERERIDKERKRWERENAAGRMPPLLPGVPPNL